MNDSLTKIFEVCIALVAAVIGLAYPMFVQSVKGLADKYGARVISEKFECEFLYKTLRPMLRVCVIELVVFPFVILLFNSHIWNIVLATVLAISVFVLCFNMIGTLGLLVVYSDPFRYLKRAKGKESSENIFQILQILIVQGAKNETNDDLYNDATREFCECLMAFRCNRVAEWNESKEKDKSKVNDFFIYPSSIFQALLQIGFRSADPENVILNKRTDIVDLLYNIADDFPITDQVYYKLIWLWIYRMVEGKHDEWMKQYWSIATQYYILKLDQPDEKEEKVKFREFHLMVGVLLFYQKRYDVLRYVFTFTNTYPPKYPLVPSTFSQIFNCCEKFPISKGLFYLAEHYNMFKPFQGAKMEYMIEGLLIDYIALLMVRLFSVNDYNITFSDPMCLPDTESTIEGNEHKINRIKAVIDHLETIPDDTIEALDFKPEWKQDAKKLLEGFIEECEKENENLKTRREVSKEKCEGIKQSLINASNEGKPFLPSSEEKDKEDDDVIFLADLEEKLPDELILESHSYLWTNLAETVIQVLHIKLREFYCGRLLQVGAIKTYLIAYRDIGEALKRLCLTHDYAIVAIGVSAHLYTEVAGFRVDENRITFCDNTDGDSIGVCNISSYPEGTVLIMKDKDVPKFRYRNLEEDEYVKEGLSEIEAKKHLYSNIDKIKADNLVLKVKQGFYVHIPKKLEYVCIRMSYRLEPDATVVSKVEPIKNHIL